MTKPKRNLGNLTQAQLLSRLRHLQVRMQGLWEGWQDRQQRMPVVAGEYRREFEKLERDELELLALVRGPLTPKEGANDGQGKDAARQTDDGH